MLRGGEVNGDADLLPALVIVAERLGDVAGELRSRDYDLRGIEV
jgi:hypothetical protein